MLAELIPKIAGFDKQEHDFYPRPSLAGPNRCQRQMVYWGLKIPREELPGRVNIVFDDGNWHEELTLEWLRKSGYKVSSQQMRIDCPTPMKTGSIDGIITDLMDNDYLLEHKAINHFTFEKLDEELPEDYFVQMAIYLNGLKDFTNKGILLIKNKNTGQYKEFSITYHHDKDILTVSQLITSTGEVIEINKDYPDIIKNSVQRFDTVLDYINKKTLPKREYGQSDWHCRYCGWSERCWKEWADEINSLATTQDEIQELTDLVAYYKESQGHIEQMSKEKDELKDKIKKIMVDKGYREGKAGDYTVSLKIQERSWLDKELLTETERNKATKITQSEMLYIRKISKKGDKKNGKL